MRRKSLSFRVRTVAPIWRLERAMRQSFASRKRLRRSYPWRCWRVRRTEPARQKASGAKGPFDPAFSLHASKSFENLRLRQNEIYGPLQGLGLSNTAWDRFGSYQLCLIRPNLFATYRSRPHGYNPPTPVFTKSYTMPVRPRWEEVDMGGGDVPSKY